MLQWLDSSGIVRLRLRNTTTSTQAGPFVLEKLDASGTVTQLGGNSATSGLTNGPTTPDKIDAFVNYSTSGSVNIVINGSSILTYSGDVTTNGVTSLSAVRLGQCVYPYFNGQVLYPSYNTWSEVLICTQDTRSLNGVMTQAIVSNSYSTATTNTAGAATTSNSQAGGWAQFSRVTCTVDGQLTALTTKLNSTGYNLDMALYSDNGSGTAPSSLLARTNTMAVTASGTQTVAISNGPQLTAGTYYWVAVEGSSNWTSFYDATISTPCGYNNTSPWPSNAPNLYSGGNPIYCGFTTQPNLNGVIADTNTPNTFASGGTLETFTLTPSAPSGTTSILSVVQHVQAMTNGTGPAHIELGCILNNTGTFLTSGTLALPTNWGLITNNMDVNPNTGSAWANTDLINAGSIYALAIESVT
jgi:hypothetical protein